MRKSHRLGLVIANPINDCPITCLTNLPEHLGPVAANSKRQASRVANLLRAGFAAEGFHDFASAETIVISAPPAVLPAITNKLLAGDIAWQRRSVIVCAPELDSGSLGEFAAAGASVASVALIDDVEDPLFLVEGDSPAVRAITRIIEDGGARAQEIRRETQQVCAAGVALATWILMPAIDAAINCFRQAGLTPRRAGAIIEPVVEKTLRSYLKGGRRAWKGPGNGADRDSFLAQLEAIRFADPELAATLMEAAAFSIRRMSPGSEWLERTPPRRAAAAAGGD